MLCINTDGLLGSYAAQHKSFLDDRGRWSQSEIDGEGKVKEGRKTKEGGRSSVSVLISTKLMCLAVQDVQDRSELTAECKPTGNSAQCEPSW